MRTAEFLIGTVNSSVNEHARQYGLLGEKGINLGHRNDQGLFLLCWANELAKIPLENSMRRLQLDKFPISKLMSLIAMKFQSDITLALDEKILILQHFQEMLKEHKAEYYPTGHFAATRFAQEVERSARELAWMSSIRSNHGRHIALTPKVVEVWGKSWQQHSHFAYHGSMDSRLNVVRALDRSGVI